MSNLRYSEEVKSVEEGSVLDLEDSNEAMSTGDGTEPDLVPVAFDRRVTRPPRPCQALHPDGSDKRVSSDANPRRGSTLLVKVSVPSGGSCPARECGFKKKGSKPPRAPVSTGHPRVHWICQLLSALHPKIQQDHRATNLDAQDQPRSHPIEVNGGGGGTNYK